MPTKNLGCFVISNTLFDEQNRFDPEAQRKHFQRLVAAKIGVFVGGGGSGNAFALTRDEYRHLVRVAKEELKGKVPFRIMGYEPRSAQQYIDLYNSIKEYEPDGMQIYSLDVGHGVRPSEKMIEGYFRDVLDVVKIPSILSSHFFAGYLIPIPMLKSLLKDYPQIVGINASTPDIGYLVEVREELGDRVELHAGGIGQALTVLGLGGNGHLAGEGNMIPKICVSVIDNWRAGNLEGAFEAYALQLRLYTGMSQFYGRFDLGERLGIPGRRSRRMRLQPTEEQQRAFDQWAATIDFDKIRRIEGLN